MNRVAQSTSFMILVVAALLSQGVPAAAGTNVTISGRVWDDLDRDGRQDGGEGGLAGYTVQLRQAAGPLVTQTVTSRTGTYQLGIAVAGDYRVLVVLPANAEATFENDPVVGDSLDSDVNEGGYTEVMSIDGDPVTADAGIVLEDVGDLVFLDRNADGYRSFGEHPLSGVRVDLIIAATPGDVIASTVTDADGEYRLIAPAAHVDEDLKIRVRIPAGMIPSPGGFGRHGLDAKARSLVVDFGEPYRMGYDFGLVSVVSVGDRVWSDTDLDGKQESGEPGVGGLTILLMDERLQRVYASVVTDAKGRYRFAAPVPGRYRIVLNPPTGARLSPRRTDLPEAIDSDVFPSGRYIGATAVLVLKLGGDTTLVDIGIKLR